MAPTDNHMKIIKPLLIIAVLLLIGNKYDVIAQSTATANAGDVGKKERQYCIEVLTRIANPVLNALSRNELKKRMPIEHKEERALTSSHLEAFGRLMSGIAPWLELGADDTPEGRTRK